MWSPLYSNIIQITITELHNSIRIYNPPVLAQWFELVPGYDLDYTSSCSTALGIATWLRTIHEVAIHADLIHYLQMGVGK